MTLRLTIEIVPFGDETKKRHLETLDISNITDNPSWENEYGNVSDYIVRGHHRDRGYWKLIAKIAEERVVIETISREKGEG